MNIGITTLSPDVLQAILGICSGYCTIRLLATGDRRLGMLVRAASFLSLDFRPPFVTSLPRLAQDFAHLHSLTVKYPRSLLYMPLKNFQLESLPASIARLDFRFFGAEQCFVVPGTANKHVNVAKLFPKLEYLRLEGVPALKNDFTLNLVGLHLRSLLLPSAMLLDENCLGNLPESITELDIPLADCKDGSWITRFGGLKSLSTLMSHSALSAFVHPNSPLMSFKSPSFGVDASWDVARTPSSARRLVLNRATLTEPLQHLHLTSLRLSLAMPDLELMLVEWPPNLRKLRLSMVQLFDSFSVARLPSSLRQLTAPMGSNALLKLPPKLTYLKVPQCEVHPTYGYALPNTLKTLIISHGAFSARCFVLLPRGLKTLHVPTLNPVSPEQIAELPLDLEDLALGTVTGFQLTRLPVALPPALTALSLESPTLKESCLADMPRTLTSLNFISGAGWSAGQVIRFLPRTLKLRTLLLPVSTDWTDALLGELPASLSALTLGESPLLFSDGFGQLPNLTSLQMSAPNITPQGAFALPRHLTSLTISRSNLDASGIAGLPRSLTRCVLASRKYFPPFTAKDVEAFPPLCRHYSQGNGAYRYPDLRDLEQP